MTIMSATFHFFNIIQNSKQRTFTISIIGKAMPINEKKDVLSGDTYHAGNDRKRKKMDIMVITKTITFIIFCTIINGNSSIFYLHQIVDAFLRMSDCCILIALVYLIWHQFFLTPDFFCNYNHNRSRFFCKLPYVPPYIFFF